MTTPRYCLIRRFRVEDQQAVKDIITEATMEQVGNFFWAALCSEILPQIAVVFIAICYIFVGIPLKFCLFSMPVVIALLYTFIWIGHWIKANELHNDLDNITSNYLKDSKTNFYVAEVYGKSGEAELAALMNKVKKVEYGFYNEREFAVKSLNVSGLSKAVVGSIAITRSLHHSKRAWIRRMAVKKEYRRRRIASRLLAEGLQFCEQQKFEAVELITTECHSEAKALYVNEGFKEIEVSHKSFFGIGGSQALYHMYKELKQSKLANNGVEASLMESQDDIKEKAL